MESYLDYLYRYIYYNYKDKVVSVLFDGIYMNSEVWINGSYLGFGPYGYIPIKYDITPYLKKDLRMSSVI